MMILFLNVNANMIELYTEEGIARIPFQDASQLYNYVEDASNILYITNAVQTTPIEVINVIKSMGVAVQDDIPVDTGTKYLHSPSPGTIYISEFLKFEGEFDVKLIDKKMTQDIHNNQLLQQLIRNKKINIIGEMQKRKIMMKYKSSQKEQLARQKSIDSGLDSIIVQTSVDDMIEQGIQDDDHSDAEVINLASRDSIDDTGGVGTMSELMNKIEGL